MINQINSHSTTHSTHWKWAWLTAESSSPSADEDVDGVALGDNGGASNDRMGQSASTSDSRLGNTRPSRQISTQSVTGLPVKCSFRTPSCPFDFLYCEQVDSPGQRFNEIIINQTYLKAHHLLLLHGLGCVLHSHPLFVLLWFSSSSSVHSVSPSSSSSTSSSTCVSIRTVL